MLYVNNISTKKKKETINENSYIRKIIPDKNIKMQELKG